MRSLYKKIHGIVFVLLLGAVGIQSYFPVVSKGVLGGVVAPLEKVEFSIRTVATGEFMSYATKHIDRILGFRSYIIRLNNQIDFSIFNTASSSGPLIDCGKDGWLYERAYLRGRIDDGTMSDAAADRFGESLKVIQRFLNNRGAAFAVVIAPSKVSIYPEYVPAHYRRLFDRITPETDYQKVAVALAEHGVTTFDGREWFLKRKGEDPDFPLFSRVGTHWSSIAVFEFAQHIVSAINDQSIVKLPNLVLVNTYEKRSVGFDRDLLSSINIWNEEGNCDMLPYPNFVKHQVMDTAPEKAVVVGDSFAWILNQYLAQSNVTPNLDMYYYYQRIIAYRNFGEMEELPMKEIDVARVAQAGNLMLLVCNENSVGQEFWGFVESAVEQIRLIVGRE